MFTQVATNRDRASAPVSPPRRDPGDRQAAGPAVNKPAAAGRHQIDINRALTESAQYWLEWQCRMIVGVSGGYVYVSNDDWQGGAEFLTAWPKDAANSAVAQGFAEQAATSGRHVLHKASDDSADSSEVRDFVAVPVTSDDKVYGVVVLALEMRPEAQRLAVLQLLEWGGVWLKRALLSLHADRREASQLALRLVAILAADLPLPVVGHQVCNLLTESVGCTRVALGLERGMQVRVVALSEQLRFDPRTERVDRIRAAMEECIDQDQTIWLPTQPGAGRALNRAHTQLLDTPDTEAVCSFPITSDDQVIGALTLIANDDALDPVTVAQLADTTRQLAPVLAMRKREAASWARRIGRPLRAVSRRLFGTGYLKTKLLAAAYVVLLSLAMLVQTDRQVAADAIIEGVIQQSIVVPMAGYLLEVHARAGDFVQKDQVLARIDDRELLLEKNKWQSQREKHLSEYQQALGERDRAKISSVSARIAQSEAELRLVDDMLQRTAIRAPFTGTLISGDLSRAIGAPLERGQMLFEIVPDADYRVSLQVDEHDIAELAEGQSGVLRLAGMPGSPTTVEVTRIVPLATLQAAGNRFRVEATLLDHPSNLRPGMHGVAKVRTGRTSVLDAWTDDLTKRLRFWFWSLGF